MLFNIGALNTIQAKSQDLNNDEGLQKASQKLQMAAGIFSKLISYVEELLEEYPTKDLSSNCLMVLSNLCMAQAEEMIILKALKVKVTYSLHELKIFLR